MAGYMPQAKTVEWETPQKLFDRLNNEFGFDLDAAASKQNAKCEKYFTKEQDALQFPWCSLGAIWCNPPYGREASKWAKKCFDESRRQSHPVVMLIPVRCDTRWWHKYIMQAHEIRLIEGRLKFSNSKTGAPFPSCVAVFRNPKEFPRIGDKVLFKAMKN